MRYQERSVYATNNILRKTRPGNYYRAEKTQWTVVPKEELKDVLFKNAPYSVEVAKPLGKRKPFAMVRLSPVLP